MKPALLSRFVARIAGGRTAFVAAVLFVAGPSYSPPLAAFPFSGPPGSGGPPGAVTAPNAVWPLSAGPFSAGRSQPAAMPHPAVARIIVAEKNAQSLGSGTLVNVKDNCGLVVTNWHVVRDATGEIQVVFPDGFASQARVLKFDKDWDLAALAIWKPNAQPVPISPHAPQKGDALTIAGYGSGNYRAATGRCTQYVSPGKKFPFEMVELSAEARQGDSGGPIFNDRGEIAGVLFGASRGTTSGSHGPRVRWFLASLVPDLDASRGESGMLAQSGGTIWQNGGTGVGAAAPGAAKGVEPYAGPPHPSGTSGWSSLVSAPNPLGAATASVAASPSVAAAPPPAVDPPLKGDEEELSSGRSDLLAPAVGGYGYGSLPDRETLVATRRIATHESTSRNGAGHAAGEFDWRTLTGETLFEQTKTALALVGILAILFTFMRPAESKGEKKD